MVRVCERDGQSHAPAPACQRRAFPRRPAPPADAAWSGRPACYGRSGRMSSARISFVFSMLARQRPVHKGYGWIGMNGFFAGAAPVAGATGALSPAGPFARSSQRPATPPPTSGEGLGEGGFWRARRSVVTGEAPPEGGGTGECRHDAGFSPSPVRGGHPRVQRGRVRERGPGGEGSRRETAARCSCRCSCVRDARPQGRAPSAAGTILLCRPLRGLGAVGNGCIVAYGARSPTRSAAEGHAQNRSASVRKCGSDRDQSAAMGASG